MKALKIVVLLASLGFALFCGWWSFFGRQSFSITSPSQIFKPLPINVAPPMFTVEAGYQRNWTFAAPEGKTPGTLSARWQSSGKSSGIKGAKDDTLVGFKLVGPNSEILQTQTEHPLSGNFNVHCEGLCKYTFVFNVGDARQEPAKLAPVTFTIEPGYQRSWTYTAPEGYTPGVLSGSWQSSGKSSGIRGATDDTLIAFKLTGPNDEVLQQRSNRPVSGNFNVQCEGVGKYTFVFNNAEFLRTSSRNVEIDATYSPAVPTGDIVRAASRNVTIEATYLPD